MDDLCDPDFYLTYTSRGSPPITSDAVESKKMNDDVIRTSEKNRPHDRGLSAKTNEPNLRSARGSKNEIQRQVFIGSFSRLLNA